MARRPDFCVLAGMAIKPSTAKVIDLDAAFDAAPIETAEGLAIWATVTIEYALAGLRPTVSIRVPVPWNENESHDRRRSQALRCARQLIEHACRAAGIGPQEPETGMDTIAAAIEAIVPPALEGVTQELGLTKPTRKPTSSVR